MLLTQYQYFIPRPLLIIGFLFSLTFATTSCGNDEDDDSGYPGVEGNGNLVEQNRNVSAFNAVSSEGELNVILKQGGSRNVKVKIDGNLQQYVKTEVKNNTLVIDNTKNIKDAVDKTVVVTNNNLNRVILKGSGDIDTENRFNSTNLSILLEGSGDMMNFKWKADSTVNITSKGSGLFRIIEGDARNLNAEIQGSGDVVVSDFELKKTTVNASGSGDIKLSFRTEKLDLELSGSGEVRGIGFIVEDATVLSGGSGDINLIVDESLSVVLKGSGNFRYKGDPEILKKVIEGSGEIIKVD